MQQRAEERPDEHRPEFSNEPQRSGLTTADLAATHGRPVIEPQMERSGEEHPSNVTPIDSRGQRSTSSAQDGQHAPLFAKEEAEGFRVRWQEIQAGFVDDPRRSAERADELVASTIKRLAEVFADERRKLEEGWSRGEDHSTEDLRVALQRYRSFFDRLLAV